MTTTSLPQRIRAFFKRRKATADDNIERSEPDTILASFQDWIFGGVLAAIWMMIAYAIMTDQITDWIAAILSEMTGPFEQRLAVFTSVLVLLSEVTVIFGVALNRDASPGDIVDVVNDLGEQIDERFAEIEDRLDERLAQIERRIE